MKYLRNLKLVQNTLLDCRMNFIDALEALGRKNPYKIAKLSINSHKRIVDFSNLSNNDYIKLGEMNLYRMLNCCLTPYRKYSMGMIKKIKNVKVAPYTDSGVTGYIYSTTIPINEFVEISSRLAELLFKHDYSVYRKLRGIENGEDYSGKYEYSNEKLHTISPIQCGIAIQATVVPRKEKEQCRLVKAICG